MKQKFNIDFIQRSACADRNRHLFSGKKKPKDSEQQNKYLNIIVQYDGKTFHSLKERHRYITLMWRYKIAEITKPEHHVQFILELKNKKICSYIADFVYTELSDNSMVVEDAKSPITRRLAEYRLKKKLMKAQYNIDIKEV